MLQIPGQCSKITCNKVSAPHAQTALTDSSHTRHSSHCHTVLPYRDQPLKHHTLQDCTHLEILNLSINFREDLGRVQGDALYLALPPLTVARFARPRLSGNEHPAPSQRVSLQQARGLLRIPLFRSSALTALTLLLVDALLPPRPPPPLDRRARARRRPGRSRCQRRRECRCPCSSPHDEDGVGSR